MIFLLPKLKGFHYIYELAHSWCKNRLHIFYGSIYAVAVESWNVLLTANRAVFSMFCNVC